MLPCERGYHKEDKIWFVTLAPEQYSYGHSLFIVIEPYDDITDPKIKGDKNLSEIFIGLHRCSKVLKDVLGAEKVYVSSLCDGVEHLHFHLIPRYHEDPTDFRFMADRARQYDQGNLFIAPKDKPRRIEYFEGLAKSLRTEFE